MINIGTEGLGNKTMSGDHSNYSIIEIGQNTEKSPGELRRPAVTQSPVRNYRWREKIQKRTDNKKENLQNCRLCRPG